MDSHAKSSSAEARIAEDAAIDESPNTAAADEPSPVNQTSSTSHQPDENRPSKNPKLDEMLQLFQKQLDLQQKQLDVLIQIAGAIDEDEPTESKAVGKQVAAAIQPDTSDWDPEAVMKWQRLRGPESPDLQRLGEHFLGFCEKKSLFWFSPTNKNIAAMIESDEESERGTTTPAQGLTLAQRLRRHWPQSLGSTDEEGNRWSFLTKADTSLLLLWYSYNEKGGFSYGENARLLTGPDLVKDTFARRFKRGGDFIQIIPYSLGKESYSRLRQPLSEVAYILLQLFNHQPRQESLFDGFEYIERFLVSYLSEWSTDPGRRRWIGPSLLMQTHSIRYFDITRSPPTKFLLSLDNIPVVRQTGRLTNTEAYLHERRLSIALVIEYQNRFPYFTIILLALDNHSYDPEDPITGGRFASVHLYISTIIGAVDEAWASWERVLTALDTELNITITDLFDGDGAELMFDEKPFPKSKLYFNMLQLSRLFISCIEETIRDLHIGHDTFMDDLIFLAERKEGSDLKKDIDNLSARWLKLIKSREPKLQVLVDRLRRKKEEIESLRDGLFNATSVREASRSTDLATISMRQNQYIFVFTVATVVFLPLGFVTSVFGMHLFDTTDPGVVAAQPKFYITIFVLSLGTYAVAGLAYWLVRNRKDSKEDGPDGPVSKEPPKPSDSKNSVNSQSLFNSDGKEATSSTSNIPTDAAKSLWGKFSALRWRKNHSPQNTPENVPV